MLHFQLLHRFSKNYRYYDLDKKPYKIYSIYYDKIDSNNFRKGWLIVNRAYTTASPNFLSTTDSLKSTSYFQKQFTKGDVDAFYIDTKETLEYIKTSITEK
jgi:hypothetical protein